MTKKDIALVLGGTVPHIELIKQLKKRGYYTILVDYLDHPLASGFSDEHIRESTLDKERILEIAIKHKATLVISTCIDQANVTACYVGEKLGLPIPYSYITSLNVTNKTKMKKILLENNIPTSRYQILDSGDTLSEIKLEFPLIVKPADSNSSKGVRMVESSSTLQEAIDKAIEVSRTDSAVIEEFVYGQEIGIDCFIVEGEAKILTTKLRRKIPSSLTNDHQIYGCIWPHPNPRQSLEAYQSIATRIAKVFGIDNCPLMIQAIEDDSGVNVIEFGARIGGGESFRLVKHISGVDYVEKAIDSFLGIPVSFIPTSPDYYYAETFIYASEGVFKKINFNNQEVEYVDTYKSSGSAITEELSSNNRVGVFTVKSKEWKELEPLSKSVISNVEVMSETGELITRKDIYNFNNE